MKNKKATIIVFLSVLYSLSAYSQDTLSTEAKIQCLYAIYFESYKKGKLELSFLEKAESMCYEVLEKDSSNFVANYYLALMYGNEIVRLQEREDLLSKKYAIYREKANHMIEESKEESEQE